MESPEYDGIFKHVNSFFFFKFHHDFAKNFSKHLYSLGEEFQDSGGNRSSLSQVRHEEEMCP